MAPNVTVDILVEARKRPRTMRDIPPAKAHQARQAALMRLHLWLTGETHKIVGEMSAQAQRIVLRYTGDDGRLDAGEMYQAQQAMRLKWDELFNGRWLPLLQAARREAASLPFGALAIEHEKYIKPQLEEARKKPRPSPVFEPQLRAILEAATQRIYADGLSLSGRVWRLERESREGINRILMQTLTEGRSAVDTAKDLERFLGASEDCPRWTSTRLNVLSKMDIAAGSRRGLFTGAECDGQGVAYKALRLARNEIQTVHHMATDRVLAAQPWVEKEQVLLSAAHAVTDICDQVAGGGEGGQGIYAVGEIALPLHVQCVLPGQMVETMDGVFPIEFISVSDLVLTHRGQYQPVVKTWNRYFDGFIFKISTSAGCLEITGEHPLLTRNGWVEAKLIRPGDDIAYAAGNIGSNFSAGITEHRPALLAQPLISENITLDITFMPATAIDFDCDSMQGQGKVNEIATDIELTHIGDAGLIQSFHHDLFGLGWTSETALAGSLEHGHETGIINFLGCGDLRRYLRSFRGGDFAASIPGSGNLTHNNAGLLFASDISLPSGCDGFTHSPHWNSAHGKQLSQNPISQTKTSEDFRGAEFLFYVNILEELLQGHAVPSFDPESMEFRHREPMGIDVRDNNSVEASFTNGACNHDNLLLLSPEAEWGAESGNPVVDELARPIQAQLDYIRVEEITCRRYSGPVFNLSVLNDNSYTVNGAVVHNCLCYKVSVRQPEAEFTGRLRGWMRGGTDAGMDGYASFVGLRANQMAESSLMNDAVAQALGVWLFGGTEAMAGRMGL